MRHASTLLKAVVRFDGGGISLPLPIRRALRLKQGQVAELKVIRRFPTQDLFISFRSFRGRKVRKA